MPPTRSTRSRLRRALALAMVAGGSLGNACDPCGEGSWVAGSVDLCSGELVYRDYVLDAFGAQSAATPPAPFDYSNVPEGDAYGLLPPSGAEREASGQELTTDLVALRLSVDDTAGTVSVSFELNALYPDSDPIVAIAIDADDNPLTPLPLGCTWPGLSAQPIGAEVCESSDSTASAVSFDAVANTIAWTFPQPAGTDWRLQAVTALADGTVMNVAFRGYGELGFWWENAQAAALRLGDISGFSHTVAVADLTGALLVEATPPTGQVLQRVYISEHTVAPHEGLDHDGVPGAGFSTANGGSLYSHAYNFLGKYQPYGFYPPSQPGPHGVQLLLHGLGENHSARLYFPGTAEGPNGGGITGDIGDAHNRVLVSPLGRGWRNWWSEYGERDALDVLADVQDCYDTDPERVFLSGYSMGGYGTYWIGSLNPDLFAGAIAWVAAAGDYLAGTPFGPFSSTGNEGNSLEMVESFRHIPLAMLYMGQDELVPATTALEARDRFASLDYEHIHYFHPVGEHLTLVPLDDWTKESAYTAGLSRVVNPPRVTYRTRPPARHPELGLNHDRAYWVSGVVPDDPGGEFADVDLRSYGCGLPDPVHGDPAVFAGFGPAPLIWTSQEIARIGDSPVPASNCLVGDLGNVAELTVDVGGSCLTPDPVSYEITTDGPATVHLSDGRDIALPGAGTHSGGPAGSEVAPTQVLLRVGASQQFTVPCAGGLVSWSVQEGAAGGSVDADGLYTAPEAITPDRLAHVEARDGASDALIGVGTVHLRQNAGSY